jgi:hypothetical protein
MRKRWKDDPQHTGGHLSALVGDGELMQVLGELMGLGPLVQSTHVLPFPFSNRPLERVQKKASDEEDEKFRKDNVKRLLASSAANLALTSLAL